MAEDRNNEGRFGGPYMVQDRDHMSEISPVTDKANRGGVGQSEQSQAGGRQQGSDDHSPGRQQGKQPRQTH
jgi:hypothetical protein